MHLRLATHADIPALERLIEASGRALSAGFYSPAQIEAITRHVFGVDSRLIDDGTYFVIEHDTVIVACGGWSRRATLFGADRYKGQADPLLDPAREPARIRAFFVAPAMARRGLGRQLLDACTRSAIDAGFQALELAATLPGVPLYRDAGFVAVDDFELELPEQVRVPLVRMHRAL